MYPQPRNTMQTRHAPTSFLTICTIPLLLSITVPTCGAVANMCLSQHTTNSNVACRDSSLFDIVLRRHLPSMTAQVTLPPCSSISPFGSPYVIQFQLRFGSPLGTQFSLARLAADLASRSGLLKNNLCGSLMGRLSITSSTLHLPHPLLLTSHSRRPFGSKHYFRRWHFLLWLGSVSLCCNVAFSGLAVCLIQGRGWEVSFVASSLTRLLISWQVRLGSVEVMRHHSLG